MAELKYVDWDGLVYYDDKIKTFIKDRDENYLKMGGVISFEELPDPSYNTLHYIYKITNKFVSNDRFENPGYIYDSGTWIICVDVNDDASRYRYVVLNEESTTQEFLNELKNYYTKEETEALIPDVSKFITEIPDSYATDAELAVKLDKSVYDSDKLTFALHSDLEAYAKSAELPTNVSELTNDAEYVTQAELNDKNYTTKTYVDTAIDNIEHPTVDLTPYATKEELKKFITEIPEEYVTETELNNKGYLTEHQDISGKADVDHNHDDKYDSKGSALAVKNELLNGAGDAYDTLLELGNLIDNNTDAIDALRDIASGKADKEHSHSEYVTHKQLEDKKYLTEHQDLSDYAKKTDVASLIPAEYVTETELHNKGYLTEHQDLSAYAKKSELDDYAKLSDVLTQIPAEYVTESELAGYKYATESFVESAIAEAELSGKDIDLTNYATKDDIKNFISEIPSEYVTESELNAKGYLTEHQDLSAYAKKSEVLTEVPAEYVTESELATYKYATESYVTEALKNIDPSVDLSEYAKKSDIPDVSVFAKKSEVITEIPDEYVTETELTSKGYATKDYVDGAVANCSGANVNLENYYTKDEVNTLVEETFDNIEIPTKVSELENDSKYLTTVPETYATKNWVEDQGFAKAGDIPNVPLDEYYTKTEVSQLLSNKSDKVVFVEDKYVSKPQGSFVAGESVKNLTMAEILTKLLGLVDTDPTLPPEPENIVDKIVTETIPMYQVNENSELVEVPYTYATFDNTTYAEAPVESCFYQKVVDGEVVESGYQHVTETNDSMYYVIALPTGMSFEENVDVLVWDSVTESWKAGHIDMSSDMSLIEEAFTDADLSVPVVPEGHTLWIDSSLDTCSGTDFRFVIKQ